MHDPLQTVDPDPADPNRQDNSPGTFSTLAPADSEKSAELPKSIGRYRLKKVLGRGGFGTVYLARDEQLDRAVAIKVPRRKRVSRPEEAEAYLAEARVVASLDHPNIVTVYDVGTTEDGLCYVVSKVIEGSDLAKLIETKRPTQFQAAELTASIASALHYAHRKGLVHRDIKPANILMSSSGVCYVADFGLALREEDFGKASGFAGTPAYMSPEQARGEGHRVDGRSDVFSLGVVFYELLVGRRPFKAETVEDLLEAINSQDVRPPRQVDDGVSKELERICLKALSKRASDRYTTAKDMGEDLRHFLSQEAVVAPFAGHEQPPGIAPGPRSVSAAQTANPVGGSTYGAASPDSSSQRPIEIVPRGLRSFEADASDFFLDLLPGPRDRQGLPDSIHFWKTRIEETDADCTFSVGLILGPSGCGKSSFVKAGLLPRLGDRVAAVYIEAAALETETRLLHGLRKRFPGLSANLGLVQTMTALRRGQGTGGKKAIIIIDQFEQWLHGNRDAQRPELAQALRQCDGGQVQCVLMVRDDFWLALTRFLTLLEVDLVQGRNFAVADLFDIRHAEKILAAFGRAFGALPAAPDEPSLEQKEFLREAVAGIADEGKVICVRLALFAEMMKGKPWTPATLKAVGGAAGVGIAFLEETFSSQAANPKHRYHQKAARAVLMALLPDSTSNIKGHMRSHKDLLEASGYSNRLKEFDDLLRILDGETRLITPTDPEGKDDAQTANESSPRSDVSSRYYQLTHDYLVPALRDWLTFKQKETRRGRAELLLADRASAWSARPENRQLPTLWQWLGIHWLTSKKSWTAPQRKMMRAARWYHLVRGTSVVLLLVAAGTATLMIRDRVIEQQQATRAAGHVERLLDAEATQTPGIIAEMEPFRRWADPLLVAAKNDSSSSARAQLNLSLALLPVDATQKQFLAERLLDAAPAEVPVLRDALAPSKDEWNDKLWAIAEQPAKGQEHQRLRAATALASYDPANPRWDKVSGSISEQLLSENPLYLGPWMNAFRPVKEKLIPSLVAMSRDSRRRESERSLATGILTDYAADQPNVLADLVVDADEKQYAVLFPKLKSHGDRARSLLEAVVATPFPGGTSVVLKRGGIISDADKQVSLPNGQLASAKLFDVPLQAGKEYRISMMSERLDSYLMIQDKAGQTLAFDDDSLGNLNALLVYTPAKDETCTIVAASLKGNGPILVNMTEGAPESAKETLAKRQANAAVALLAMGAADKVWPFLKHSPDPRVRSYLIQRFSPLGADAAMLAKRLEEESDVSIRRALILSLGDFGDKSFAADERKAVIKRIEDIYRTAADPGLHGAAEWVLRRWKDDAWLKSVNDEWAAAEEIRAQRLAAIESTEKGKSAPGWYVNSQGQTMVVIPGPVEFRMGSPPTEAKRQIGEFPHKKIIGRSFAIASTPVTVAQFRRFDPKAPFAERYAPTSDCPIVSKTWHEAAAYCNWLSEQDGIEPDQMCYDIDANGQVTKLKSNSLALKGYRLPTEAELEFATRAGAATSRCFGESDELLGRYGWFLQNSQERAWPIASKLPNDLGLFDVHGNVWNWCHDIAKNYPSFDSSKAIFDRDPTSTVRPQDSRPLRGGSFDDQASYLRSAYRNSHIPAFRFNSYGFRVARTLKVEP